MISLPNELLMQIIYFTTDKLDLIEYLFVCKYTFGLVKQRVYNKVIFPDDIDQKDVIKFCKLYGQSLLTIKLPQQQQYCDSFYEHVLKSCPKLNFLQSNIYPKQLLKLNSIIQPTTCFLTTNTNTTTLELELFQSTYQSIPCCQSYFIFPNNELLQETLTQISHYFHHPGALSNAILPTFGSDLLSLTLNPYDVLTCSVARLIVSKCPKLRYLIVPSVKAEGLWMLLRWCHTLSTIIVGEEDDHSTISIEDDEEEEDEEDRQSFNSRRLLTEIENERAVETIKNHKRVWCVHSTLINHQSNGNRILWHIGIIPKL